MGVFDKNKEDKRDFYNRFRGNRKARQNLKCNLDIL